jgi:hypothetical protein
MQRFVFHVLPSLLVTLLSSINADRCTQHAHLVPEIGEETQIRWGKHVVHGGDALAQLDVQAAVATAQIEPCLRHDLVDLKKLLGVLLQHKLVLICQPA